MSTILVKIIGGILTIIGSYLIFMALVRMEKDDRTRERIRRRYYKNEKE